MRLILARHGQSWANIDPVKYGEHDSPLTPLGESQAHKLGQWLSQREPEIDLIFSSPLQRAKKTAEIVNGYLKVAHQVDPDLSEIERFDLPLLDQRTHPFDPTPPPGSETRDDYYHRYKMGVRRSLERLLADLNRPKPILVVAHGGTNATLLRWIFERHDLYFSSHNTSFSILAWQGNNWHIHGFNQTPHLPADMIS
jgi:broad specificity phosphatase PhoE